MVWNISPEIFYIESIGWGLRYYSLLFMLTILIGYRVFGYNCKKNGITGIDLDRYFIYIFVGIILGARLGHVLFYDPVFYVTYPGEIIKIWKGGLASHGGIIGIILATVLYCRKDNVPFATVIDLLTISTMMVFLIRIGNFFNSEIIGTPSDLPWAVVFERVDTVPRHPAQLYEAILYAIVFGVLMFINHGLGIRPGSLRISGTGLVLGFSARFIAESFKENQSVFENALPLNMGQLLSIPFIILGLYLFFRKQPEPETDPVQNKPSKKHTAAASTRDPAGQAKNRSLPKNQKRKK